MHVDINVCALGAHVHHPRQLNVKEGGYEGGYGFGGASQGLCSVKLCAKVVCSRTVRSKTVCSIIVCSCNVLPTLAERWL